MKERLFRFKQFSVNHTRSAMKVGVDGVLIGAWASCRGSRMLDVGTGCGLIALMLAQRNGEAIVDAIDVDSASVEEAVENVARSPWPERVEVGLQSFSDLVAGAEHRYDIIVSNPPFFHSGVTTPLTARERSRHQGELSPLCLIMQGCKLLNPGGRLAMIVPSAEADFLIDIASVHSMSVVRICYVKDHDAAFEKRVMLEFALNTESYEPEITHLTMFNPDRSPSDEYRALCSPFYLKF